MKEYLPIISAVSAVLVAFGLMVYLLMPKRRKVIAEVLDEEIKQATAVKITNTINSCKSKTHINAAGEMVQRFESKYGADETLRSFYKAKYWLIGLRYNR